MKSNLPLEKWWAQLAEGKAILIYKDHKKSTLKKQWNQWDADDCRRIDKCAISRCL